MVLKGTIQPDHIPVNNFQLLVAGIIPITLTKISGLEREIEVAEMPDRTKASGGNMKVSEFTATLPLHHTVERLALEAWLRESQDPVLPTYKKDATLVSQSISRLRLRPLTLIGLWPSKIKEPDRDMKNEGELAELEITFQVDDVLPG